MCACDCAGMQAGGYVCNLLNFKALELIGWSVSESSWFSVLLCFFWFPSPSFYNEILLFFPLCLYLWDSSVGCQDWKNGRIIKVKQTQINPAPYNSTLGKFFWFYHCNFAYLLAAFLSRELYQVMYLVVGQSKNPKDFLIKYKFRYKQIW